MNWRGFLNAAFGIWLISSPFTFGYKSLSLVYSDVVAGCLAILLGLLTIHRPFFAWGTALIGPGFNSPFQIAMKLLTTMGPLKKL